MEPGQEAAGRAFRPPPPPPPGPARPPPPPPIGAAARARPSVAWAARRPPSAPASASPHAPAPVANRRTPRSSAPRTMEVLPWVPGTAPSPVSAAKARDAATRALTAVTCSADARALGRPHLTLAAGGGGRAPAQLAAVGAGEWGNAREPGPRGAWG